MTSQNILLKTVLDQNPVEKRLLGRFIFRWEDTVKKVVDTLMNRDG